MSRNDYNTGQYKLDSFVGRKLDEFLEEIDTEAQELNLAPSEAHKVLNGYDPALADWYQEWYLDSGEEWE